MAAKKSDHWQKTINIAQYGKIAAWLLKFHILYRKRAAADLLIIYKLIGKKKFM